MEVYDRAHPRARASSKARSRGSKAGGRSESCR
jgi:hypothetical protein